MKFPISLLKTCLYLLLALSIIGSSLKFFHKDETQLNDLRKMNLRLTELRGDLDEIEGNPGRKVEIKTELADLSSKLERRISYEQAASGFDLREDLIDPLFLILLIAMLSRIKISPLPGIEQPLAPGRSGDGREESA